LDVVDERFEPGTQCIHRRELRVGLGASEEVRRSGAYDLDVELVLGREVVEQQAPGDAGLLGKVLDRHFVQGPGGEQLHAERDQLGPALRGRESGAPLDRRSGPRHVGMVALLNASQLRPTVVVMTRISGKVAVVTGAASGIGREVSYELARRGARLAISDVDEV